MVEKCVQYKTANTLAYEYVNVQVHMLVSDWAPGEYWEEPAEMGVGTFKAIFADLFICRPIQKLPAN